MLIAAGVGVGWCWEKDDQSKRGGEGPKDKAKSRQRKVAATCSNM